MSLARIAVVSWAALWAVPALAAPAGAWRGPVAVRPAPPPVHVVGPRMPGRLAVGQVRPFHHGRFYPRAWTTFGPTGWGTVGPSTVVFVPGPSPDRPLRPVLPTTADLPVVNIVRETADPPLLYVVNDLTRGRSTRPGGARIVYAGPARPLGRAPVGMRSEGGPHIIELTAR